MNSNVGLQNTLLQYENVSFTFVDGNRHKEQLIIFFEEQTNSILTKSLISAGYNTLIIHNLTFKNEVENQLIGIINEEIEAHSFELENINIIGTETSAIPALYYGIKLGINEVIIENPFINNSEILNELLKVTSIKPKVTVAFYNSEEANTNKIQLHKINHELNEKLTIKNIEKNNTFVDLVQSKILSNVYKLNFDDVSVTLDANFQLSLMENENLLDNYNLSILLINENYEEEYRFNLDDSKSYNIGFLQNKTVDIKNYILALEISTFETIISQKINNLYVSPDFIMLNPIVTLDEDKLEFELNISTAKDYEYAFYLKNKNDKLVEKKLYSDNKHFSTILNSENEYYIKYFIKLKSDPITNKKSFESERLIFIETDSKKINRLQKEIKQLKSEMKKLNTTNSRIMENFIVEKKEKIELQETIVRMLKKESTLLKSHKKLMGKYNALSKSKLGKLTIQYWNFLKKVKRG